MGIEQGVSIAVGGGLDKTSSSYELFKTPGVATRLRNYEASMEGGYRRINGFRQYVISPVVDFTIVSGGAGYSAGATANIVDPDGNGSGATATVTITNGAVTGLSLTAAGSGYQTNPTVTITTSPSASTVADITVNINTPTSPTGGTTPINGIHPYKEGFWVCQGGNIYWGENGYEWTQVNKDYGTASAGATTTQQTTEEANNVWTAGFATAAQISSTAAVSLSTTARYQFSEYIPSGYPNARICAVNGTDAPVYLETKLVSGTRQFRFHRGLYDAFGLSKTTPVYADIPKPQYTEVHIDHTIIGGWDEKPETVYYSTRYNDANYTGASAGFINISDKITGLKVWREQFIVFGVNSLQRIVNINNSSTTAVESITNNIGCLDGFSIAEIGGDLVFLAPDGMRTVAATARIDDIELSSISHKILPIVNELVANLDSYDLCATVIRTKNQYRLFYSSATTGADSKGIVGTFKISPQGMPLWEWSEILGIQISSMGSGFNTDEKEITYHGDYDGKLHFHNTGNSFDGEKISAEYRTPDIDYGDIGVRKTLHFTKLSIKPEGLTDLYLDTKYDFESGEIQQPASTHVGSILVPSLFGTAKFSVGKFGVPEYPMKRVSLFGSGYSNSFKFTSNDTNPPYSIQGMYVDLIPASRR